jgi:hypothetical protein
MNRTTRFSHRGVQLSALKTHQLALLLLLMTLAIADCGQQNAPTAVVTDLQIELAVEPAPPATGDSTLIVTLKDANGVPVSGATISVEGNMDHAGMEPTTGQTSQGEGGIYRVPFYWTMGGGWSVTVTATLPGGGVATETIDMFVEAVSSSSVIHQTEEAGSG